MLVNTDKHLGDIIGITKEALSRGHEVSIFTMDSGTKLLESDEYLALCQMERVRIAFCSHSAGKEGLATGSVPRHITCGSQFDNALMSNESDVVVVL
jgi:hypothetical protein